MTRTDYTKLFTKHSAGDKMEDLRSINTSPLENEFCKLRHNIKGLICNKCYSIAFNKYRKNLKEKLKRNTEILTSEIIPVENIPFINDIYFRIESFGDLQNVTQAINYINLIKVNTHVNFAWWTKNPVFIKKAFDQLGIEKPHNVQIVFSCPCINKEIDIKIVQKVFPFIDKVFTVFDDDFIAENDIDINCGKRHCIECQNCYKKGGNVQVRERLK